MAPDDLAHAPTRLTTDDGVALEARWSGTTDARAVVVLTHPHPGYGGDMDNLVPATLARTLPEHGLATLRFNFRGTGASSGSHGHGRAEIADVRAALHAASAALPDRPVLAVGYSFGADVLLAVPQAAATAIVAVAPPLAVLPVDELAAARTGAPTLILSPEHDQFRPTAEAVEETEQWAATRVRGIAGADHFLAGAMSRVVDQVMAFFDPMLDAAG